MPKGGNPHLVWTLTWSGGGRVPSVNISAQPITPQTQMDTLFQITKCWLQPEFHSTTQVAEKVALDQFLHSLLPAEWMAIRMKAPKTPKELVEALEYTLTALNIAKSKTLPRPQEPLRPQFGAKSGISSAPSKNPQAPPPKMSPCPLHLSPPPWAEQ